MKNDEKIARFDNALRIVNHQAEDDALWFITTSIAEAYLQQELRHLHAALEGEDLPVP